MGPFLCHEMCLFLATAGTLFNLFSRNLRRTCLHIIVGQSLSCYGPVAQHSDIHQNGWSWAQTSSFRADECYRWQWYNATHWLSHSARFFRIATRTNRPSYRDQSVGHPSGWKYPGPSERRRNANRVILFSSTHAVSSNGYPCGQKLMATPLELLKFVHTQRSLGSASAEEDPCV
jgi:hypothetical protein